MAVAKITFLPNRPKQTAPGNGNIAALPATMPRRRPTTREIYTPYLRRFMSWKDGTDYAVGTVFTNAQLLEIRPSHIVRYMSLLAYGSKTPTDND